MDFIKFGVRRLLRGNFNLFRMRLGMARRVGGPKKQIPKVPIDYDV